MISTEQIAEKLEYKAAYQQFKEGTLPFSTPGLSLEDQILLLYRQALRQELANRLEGDFWISEDIAVAESITLLPGETRQVAVLLPTELGPFTNLNDYALTVVFTHTRSRFAQIGLEVLPASGTEIARTIKETEINQKIRKVAYVPVTNHAARPIKLAKNSTLFCLYYWDGKMIEGKNLVDSVGSDILLDGKEGKDWAWWYGSLPDGQQGKVQGIELFLDMSSFKLIPTGDEAVSIHHGPDENHNRTAINQFLNPVDHDVPQEKLYIAETRARLEISQKVHAILDQALTRYGEGEIIIDEWFYQINSVILQGGNTHNRIRVEILCNGQFPTSVFISFASSGKTAGV